jgi:serine phosphatase RsbU (regulator of sigma subunit)
LPHLVVKEGRLAGRRFELAGEMDIGRDSTAGVAIDDRTISRRHAHISVADRNVVLTDLKSQNGTSVNRRRISAPTRLADGDEVRVGALVLTFHSGAAAPPEASTTSVRLVESAATIIASLAVSDTRAALAKESERLTAQALRKRLDVLHDVAIAFHLTLDESALLSRILEKILEVLPAADRGFIVLLEDDGETLRPGAVKVKPGVPEDVSVSKTLVWDVIRNRRGIVSADARLDARLQEIHSITSLDLRAVCCVPMIADGQVQGVIALDSLTSAGAFGKDELSLLVAVAAQAALSLAKARLHKRLVAAEIIERDLELAERIQTRFLPREGPSVRGWDFTSYYRAAIEVGGDYYDFIDLPEGHVAVGLGDVSGKGISAALCMVRLSTEVRFQCAGRLQPADVLRDVNRVLTEELEAGMFVTALLVLLDPRTGDLSIASAGHMPPLVRRTDGSVVELGVAKAPPLGVVETAVFKSRAHRLENGEVAVLYTDGISEANAPGGALFGMERLVRAISSAEGTPKGVMSAILDAVREFTAGEAQADDVTLLCFGPTGAAGPVSTWSYPAIE